MVAILMGRRKPGELQRTTAIKAEVATRSISNGFFSKRRSRICFLSIKKIIFGWNLSWRCVYLMLTCSELNSKQRMEVLGGLVEFSSFKFEGMFEMILDH